MKYMKKFFKVFGIIILGLVILGAIFWQRIYFTGATMFFAGERCTMQLCDTNVQSRVVPTTNEPLADNITHRGVAYEIPFTIATSSAGESVVRAADTVSRADTDKSVIIFGEPVLHIQDMLAGNDEMNAGKIATIMNEVGSQLVTETSPYELMYKTLAFTPDQVNYSVSFDRLVEQLLLLLAKSTIFYEQEIYAVEQTDWRGFVLVGGSQGGIEVMLFGRDDETEMINWHTNNLSLDDVLRMVSSVDRVDSE